MIDVVQLFKDKAELKEWKAVYGVKEYQEFGDGGFELAPNQEVLMIFPFRSSPVIEGGYWSRYKYTTQLWLCRKHEDDTESNVGETEQEKYSNRLRDLHFNLDLFLKDVFMCGLNIEANSINYFRELNQLSASIDGCTADISFTIWE